MDGSLSQADKIFGALVIGFFIYVTVRGQLPQYIELFTKGDASPPPPKQSSSSGSSNIGGDVQTAVSIAKVAAMFAGG